MINNISTNLESISLGEGNTPLLRLFNLEKKLSWSGQIWAKCEFLNPTGSFKDRGSLTEVSQAKKLGKRGVVCASTGNMAASLSAYSAKAKLDCVVIVPQNTPPGKLKQALMCGAKIKKVKGNYDNCVKKAEQFAIKNNFLLCGDYELRRLGQSTVGVELAQSRVDFDAVIVPVGNGTLGCAVSEGLASYGKFPKLIGVQGGSANPIYKAWKNKNPIINIDKPKTIASAMKVGSPLDGNMTLEWIRKTNGKMFSVSDNEIAKCQQLLAKEEGLYVEKSAAAVLASLKQINMNLKNEDLNIVLILTGSGLKEI